MKNFSTILRLSPNLSISTVAVLHHKRACYSPRGAGVPAGRLVSIRDSAVRAGRSIQSALVAILRSRSRSSPRAPRGLFGLDCFVPFFALDFSLHIIVTGRCQRPNGPYVTSPTGLETRIYFYGVYSF